MQGGWGMVPAVIDLELPVVIHSVVHDVEITHLILAVGPGGREGGR